MGKYELNDKTKASPKVLPSLGGKSKSYIKKAKEYEKQIEILNKENRVLKDNIKSLNDQLYKRNQNFENEGTDNKNNRRRKGKYVCFRI